MGAASSSVARHLGGQLDFCDGKSACPGGWTPGARSIGADFPESADGTAHDGYDATEPFGRHSVCFPALGAVPDGWRIVGEPAPEGFLFYGGAACIIERTSEPSGAAGTAAEAPAVHRRVLVALPTWAVDVRRAQCLAQVAANTPERVRHLVRLWRVCCCDVFGSVVLEFDFPNGEALNARLRRSGCLEEEEARVIGRQLLEALTNLRPTPLRLWGLLGTTEVYLGEEGSLTSILPLACLLSFKGAKSTALTFSLGQCGHSRRLPPELKRAVLTTERLLAEDAEARAAADVYAVGALLLEASTPKESIETEARNILEDLPDGMSSMLLRMLYSEPEWRLTAEEALVHAWMLGRVSGDMQARKQRVAAVGGG
mmetsp:Transcript_56127/g.180136  ORF Transcript_56127/g.180136 Transcript_56127/m.180136 type:complete len:371 (+) Transcript_56127:59-1171(+)